jgi:hypothetical protein
MYLSAWTAWLLIALLISWDLHGVFVRYSKGGAAWELAAQALLLATLGYLVVYLGLFSLRMQFDLGVWARPVRSHRRLIQPAPAAARPAAQAAIPINP